MSKFKYNCKVCNARISNYEFKQNGYYCFKCSMNKRTDLDRTGRSSKKDKYNSKNVRKKFY